MLLEMRVIGNLGRDAEVKEINGQKVINFSVAHTYAYNNNQGVKVESTTWVRCEYWVKKDGVSKFLTKGKVVHVLGVPKVYAYRNQEGNIVGSLQLRVTELTLIGGGARREESGDVTPEEAAGLHQAAGGEVPQFGAASPAGIADDLPF